MSEPRRLAVSANGVQLNLYRLGPEPSDATPPVVMLHGMRDVGLSLLPIAEAIAKTYPVFLMDLRGHGESDKPGGYAMVQLVYDLHVVVSELVKEPAVLFGHSLGGHVVCRFSALFPELALGAVVVEGLGPPAGRLPEDPRVRLKMEAERILGSLSIPEQQRPLPDIAFAADRLMANNPRLTADRAMELARQGTRVSTDGQLEWNFDPRVQTVFVGSDADADASERYWGDVRCPVSIIAGDLAGEYWSRAVSGKKGPADSDWTGDFAPGELEARVATFLDAELVRMPGSGHMVHFDEPERLARATLDFLERRL
jgi:pimeloyl-ACP methyl ester carboxylesterase